MSVKPEVPLVDIKLCWCFSPVDETSKFYFSTYIYILFYQIYINYFFARKCNWFSDF